MFSGTATADLWSELKKAYSFGDRTAFTRLLTNCRSMVAESRDELRLLFFIAKEFDRFAYEATLAMMESWRYQERTPLFNYACATFLYAVRHTMPPKMLAAKPYIIPLFLDKTGYKETGDPDTAPVMPAA